jgi:hypothetical protein
MQIHIVLEIVNGNEGNPAVFAFQNRESAAKCARRLRKENGITRLDPNPDVLIVRQSINLEP